MPFNIDSMTLFASERIAAFADQHRSETFYAFAIDASLLCLNSKEAEAETLQRYQNNWENEHRPIKNLAQLSAKEWDLVHYQLELHYTIDLIKAASELPNTFFGRIQEWLLDLKIKRMTRRRPWLRNEAACIAVINESRAKKQNEENPYKTPKKIQSLRNNTGDWQYQGFAEMGESDGFDMELYNQHYYMNQKKQKTSQYGVAMDTLLKRLEQKGAFECLNRSPDFRIMRVEHNY